MYQIVIYSVYVVTVMKINLVILMSATILIIAVNFQQLDSLKKIYSKFSGSDVDTESGYVVSCLDGSRQVATECQNFSPKPSSEEEEEG